MEINLDMDMNMSRKGFFLYKITPILGYSNVGIDLHVEIVSDPISE
jgi:hypothetical protein